MHSVYEEDRASPMGKGLQCDIFQLNIINCFFLIRTVIYKMCDTAGREILLGMVTQEEHVYPAVTVPR